METEKSAAQNDERIKARLRHISREMEICRHTIFMLEVEEKHLFEELTRTAPKPTVVKPSVVSTEMLPCHLCNKKTRNKVNGLFECREHSVVSRMSELQRRVLNEFMQ